MFRFELPNYLFKDTKKSMVKMAKVEGAMETPEVATEVEIEGAAAWCSVGAMEASKGSL